jgi:hypothetical protein
VINFLKKSLIKIKKVIKMAKLDMAKTGTNVIATATKHPYLTTAVILGGGIIAIFLVSDILNKGQQTSQGVSPTSESNPTQTTNPTQTPTLSTPITTSQPTTTTQTTNPYQISYQEPSQSIPTSAGVSGIGLIGGNLTNEPNIYTYSPQSYYSNYTTTTSTYNSSSNYSYSSNVSNQTSSQLTYSPQTSVNVSPTKTTQYSNNSTFGGQTIGYSSGFGSTNTFTNSPMLNSNSGGFFSGAYKTAEDLVSSISNQNLANFLNLNNKQPASTITTPNNTTTYAKPTYNPTITNVATTKPASFSISNFLQPIGTALSMLPLSLPFNLFKI